jgi:hypothetical protein
VIFHNVFSNHREIVMPGVSPLNWHSNFEMKRKKKSMRITSAIGGLAGACALTLINQIAARVDKQAPRLDLLGMNAVAKFFKNPKAAPVLFRKLLPMSVAGDLLSNTLYYAMASGRTKDNTLLRGLLLGLGAGLGAVVLPKPLGLDASTTNLTRKTQAMTMAWYILGGLVAAAVMNAIEEKESRHKKVTVQDKELVSVL